MLPFILALAASVTAQAIGPDHFRLTIVFGGDRPFAHAQAQLKLAAAAERLCKGKGRPVSGGALELNEVPKTDKAGRKRGRLSLSEEWQCVPPLQRPPI